MMMIITMIIIMLMKMIIIIKIMMIIIMIIMMMIMTIITISYLLYQALSLSGNLQSTIVRLDQKDPSLHWNSYKSIEGG